MQIIYNYKITAYGLEHNRGESTVPRGVTARRRFDIIAGVFYRDRAQSPAETTDPVFPVPLKMISFAIDSLK